MISAPDSPAATLARLVGGTVVSWSAIQVGDRFIDTSPVGVVRVGRTIIGRTSDGPQALAAAFAEVAHV